MIISHNGINYGVVVSPISGRTWLDRNIGAKQVCATPYDIACYGDYYQWGRNTDGHEKPQSKTTTKKGKTITNSGNKFVINNSEDWTSSKNRGANWRAIEYLQEKNSKQKLSILKIKKINLRISLNSLMLVTEINMVV